MNDTNVNLNNNQSNCIQSRATFGHYEYSNICTGTRTELPWASGEWVLIIGALIFVIVVGWGIKKMITDY